MLERLHQHMTEELTVNTRTDTLFVIIAVIFNFVMLGISSAFAGPASSGSGRGGGDVTALVILFINFILSIMVNGISIMGLITGRATRQTMLEGLMKMYEDAGVNQYYHPSLATNYQRRYTMFIGINALIGAASILIPLVILLTG